MRRSTDRHKTQNCTHILVVLVVDDDRKSGTNSPLRMYIQRTPLIVATSGQTSHKWPQ